MKELDIENIFIKELDKLGICPFSIIFTYAGPNDGTLSITMYLKSDVKELLKYLDYYNRCDKSGYLINEDRNTVVIYGMALIDLYTKLCD